METVTIDFDNVKERIDEAHQCLIDFLPCKARISGGKNGIHLKKYCFSSEEYEQAMVIREKYDDKNRFMRDKWRQENGLITNILFDIKYDGNVRKVAGEWKKILNSKNVNEFMEMIENVEQSNIEWNRTKKDV